MGCRLNVIKFHDSLHGYRNRRGMGTATMEAKLSQQLAYLEQTQLYRIFIDLCQAFDAMDRERCLDLLQPYNLGPNMLRLIKAFWNQSVLVC